MDRKLNGRQQVEALAKLANPDPKVLRIASPIGPHGFGAADLAEALAEGVEKIVIDSQGGSGTTAAGMIDQIEAAGLSVETHRAASAAALIAIAGPDRSIAADGWIGIHPVWTVLAGGAFELAEACEAMASSDRLMAEMIAARSRLTVEQAVKAIEACKVWDAEAALADGLVDRIVDPLGLPEAPPETLDAGPERAYPNLRAQADQYRERVRRETEVLERSRSAAGMNSRFSIRATAFTLFAPPARLAVAFDHAATVARTEGTHGPEPGEARWMCQRCGGINYLPPTRRGAVTPCFHCQRQNERTNR